MIVRVETFLNSLTGQVQVTVPEEIDLDQEIPAPGSYLRFARCDEGWELSTNDCGEDRHSRPSGYWRTLRNAPLDTKIVVAPLLNSLLAKILEEQTSKLKKLQILEAVMGTLQDVGKGVTNDEIPF